MNEKPEARGPLAARKKPEPRMAPMPAQKPVVNKDDKPKPFQTPKKKKLKKEFKHLMMFDNIDERNFHPTISLAIVNGVLWQRWRHRETNIAEWRLVPVYDELPVEKEPARQGFSPVVREVEVK